MLIPIYLSVLGTFKPFFQTWNQKLLNNSPCANISKTSKITKNADSLTFVKEANSYIFFIFNKHLPGILLQKLMFYARMQTLINNLG